MMKLNTHKAYYLVVAALFIALAANPLAAEVYKVVDKDGNVTFTDQPPGDGTKPMELAPLSVVETPVYETQVEAAAKAKAGEDEPLSSRELRKLYRDFSIVAPQSEESVWHPDAPVTVAWSTGRPLVQGMEVSVSVDGKLIASTTDTIVPVANLERGEHRVTAELKDSNNQKIASAEPVVFFVRRPSVNTVRARPNG
jgi:hypothetical protein